MYAKNNQVKAIKQLIHDSFSIGKKVVRRTKKSAEYRGFEAIKKTKENNYDMGCMLFRQKMNKSKSVAGDCPVTEGYVVELGMDNKTKDG